MKPVVVWSCACLAFCLHHLSFATPYSLFEKKDKRHWKYTLMLESSYGLLDGSLVNSTSLVSSDNDAQGLASSFFASGDSMNFTHELIPGFSGAMSSRNLALTVKYTPIRFTGTGLGFASLTSDQGFGGFLARPLESDFQVELITGHVNYHVISTPNTVFGLGVGLGQVDIDLNMESGETFAYNYAETEPFGSISIHMASIHDGFYYGFTVNAMAGSYGDVAEDYSDYKIDLAYQVIDASVTANVLAGWRFQNLGFDVRYPNSAVSADMELKGPYVGLSFTW